MNNLHEKSPKAAFLLQFEPVFCDFLSKKHFSWIICLRSEQLKRAWLCARLIADFLAPHEVSDPHFGSVGIKHGEKQGGILVFAAVGEVFSLSLGFETELALLAAVEESDCRHRHDVTRCLFEGVSPPCRDCRRRLCLTVCRARPPIRHLS